MYGRGREVEGHGWGDLDGGAEQWDRPAREEKRGKGM